MSGSKENCVSVSGYKLVNCDKPYYAYVIHVRMFQQHYIIEKRYSELLRCHTELKTKFSTPHFPPKKIRSNQKLLDERRHLLEVYLKEMFKFGPSRNQVLAFLGVNSKNSQPQPSTSKNNNENRTPIDSNTPRRIEHQPVFIVNPNIDRISQASGEHDLIVNGAMKAFYG